MPHPELREGTRGTPWPQPEKGAGPEEKFVGASSSIFHSSTGAEEEDFERQSLHHPPVVKGLLMLSGFIQEVIFAVRDRRDMEWNRSACPFQHP